MRVWTKGGGIGSLKSPLLGEAVVAIVVGDGVWGLALPADQMSGARERLINSFEGWTQHKEWESNEHRPLLICKHRGYFCM